MTSFPLAMELTSANSRREVKMKTVLTRNQMSINLIYCTLDILSFMLVWRLIKVNQLAVPEIIFLNYKRSIRILLEN